MNKQEKLSITASTTVTTESKTLTDEEERVLRMRTGISLPSQGALESKLDGLDEDIKSSVVARLALIQMEVLRNQASKEHESVDTGRRTHIVEALKLLATDD